jgi:hypothetical protein
MDPDALWRELCDRLRDLYRTPDDVKLRQEVMRDLLQLHNWLQRGGFPPNLGD